MGDSRDDVDSNGGLPIDSDGERSSEASNDSPASSGGHEPLTVSTGLAANLTSTTGTFEGSLDSLDGAGVRVGFEYRAVGEDSWTVTPMVRRSTGTTFERRVDGLPPGTDHEFRAVAIAGETAVSGGIATFTTPAADTGPSVDSLEASEVGAAGTHAEITVDWAVSSGGAELSTVLLKVLDQDRWLQDATTATVEGDRAHGIDYFRCDSPGDATLSVKLTAADEEGVTATELVELK